MDWEALKKEEPADKVVLVVAFNHQGSGASSEVQEILVGRSLDESDIAAKILEKMLQVLKSNEVVKDHREPTFKVRAGKVVEAEISLGSSINVVQIFQEQAS
jgi:hypothetical protein